MMKGMDASDTLNGGYDLISLQMARSEGRRIEQRTNRRYEGALSYHVF